MDTLTDITIILIGLLAVKLLWDIRKAVRRKYGKPRI